ncbi:MAG: DegV family protein [Marmoricola sp.]|nr:DegV family protein [Marmoricola sp.]
MGSLTPVPAPTSSSSALGPVGIVTDSTASLGVQLAREHGVVVVPLQVVVAGTAYEESADAAASGDHEPSGDPTADDPGAMTAGGVADALRRKRPVTTSRPNPEALLEVYEKLAAEGVEGIVSIHLSSELSGTIDSARLAAPRSPVPVRVVDTRQVGMGTGYAVLAAAASRDAGGDLDAATSAAERRAAATTSLFYVDTLEHLRRGGRVGAAAALLGTALAVKPILQLVEGRVAPVEKVRTAAKALARLEELAVRAALDVGTPGGVDVAVAHLLSPDRAWQLADALAERLGDVLASEVRVLELGPVLGAHTGPGTVAVTVAPRG